MNSSKENYLFTACKEGDIVRIQELIKSGLFSKGANVNAVRKDSAGNIETPLICAINSANKEVAALLISAGAHVNAVITNNRTKARENFYSHHHTPLICAIRSNSREMTELIIKAGADINSGYSEDEYPLICAIKCNNNELVELLISRGADVNFNFKTSPLLCAIKMGNKPLVQLLISKGADVNMSPSGIKPLIYALQNDFVEIAELIFLKGGKGYSRGDATGLALTKGFIALTKLMLIYDNHIATDALEYAFKSDDKELLVLLFKLIDNIFETSSYHESSKWAEYCNPDTLRYLISVGLDIKKKNSNGDTPLYDAIVFGSEEIVDILLSNGADTNTVRKSGESALCVAIQENKEKIVELLLNKYSVEFKDEHSGGYLAMALRIGSRKIAELLLSKGYMAVDKCESNNCTPLLYSVNYNFQSIVNSLIERGADINRKSDAFYRKSLIEDGEDGFTPLHLASQKGYTSIVELLLKNGASVECQTDGHMHEIQDCDGDWRPTGIINKGRTPLFYALKNNHQDVVKLLQEYGAVVAEN